MEQYVTEDDENNFILSSFEHITIGICDDEHYVHDLIEVIMKGYKWWWCRNINWIYKIVS